MGAPLAVVAFDLAVTVARAGTGDGPPPSRLDKATASVLADDISILITIEDVQELRRCIRVGELRVDGIVEFVEEATKTQAWAWSSSSSSAGGCTSASTAPRSAGYAIVNPDDVREVYAGSDVPGEFRPLTEALGGEQLAATLIRVDPHSDFEQGTGHLHDEVEELYLVTRGTLTMRFGDEVRAVRAPAAVRVAAGTPRSHRNEGDEPVEMWAISLKLDHGDATKIDAFWDASPGARQHRD